MCVRKHKPSRPDTSVLYAYIYHSEQNHGLLKGVEVFRVRTGTSV